MGDERRPRPGVDAGKPRSISAARPSGRGAPGKRPQEKQGASRKAGNVERKQAILRAALSVFAERGFESARLDDVAARAGVAKGTLYLYFDDKEKLFEEVVQSEVSPILDRIGALASARDMPIEKILEALFQVFEKEVLGTERKHLLRLIIAEGPRFPHIAELYFRNVIGRAMPLISRMAAQAVVRGELQSDALVRFPQLVGAPLLFAVVWDSMFARLQPLDVAGFFAAHRETLVGKMRRTRP
ncbi:TetR/AcrR family transcriptional regulator [Hyphomicrobium sp.]|uniref:TetR/AcrR family transcriptional regulator n=1 Tax=Hyphomicrobium sp. TaxID=82 RepID=UPI0025C39C64|nr:TetR/AcrR family transcriptional regulator [Hyphomicrobium sp.]MCC7254040.1 TetR/AcrR family transcriptional regulator [Hyphomicrobium sp.]